MATFRLCGWNMGASAFTTPPMTRRIINRETILTNAFLEIYRREARSYKKEEKNAPLSIFFFLIFCSCFSCWAWFAQTSNAVFSIVLGCTSCLLFTHVYCLPYRIIRSFHEVTSSAPTFLRPLPIFRRIYLREFPWFLQPVISLHSVRYFVYFPRGEFKTFWQFFAIKYYKLVKLRRTLEDEDDEKIMALRNPSAVVG